MDIPRFRISALALIAVAMLAAAACAQSAPSSAPAASATTKPAEAAKPAATTAPAAPAAAAKPAATSAPAAAAAPAQKIKLRAADSLPETHIMSKGFKAWRDRVIELTKGQVEFEYYPSEQLGKRKDLLKLAQDGVSDISYILPMDQPNILPRTTVVEIPGFTSSGKVGLQTMLKLVGDFQDKEYIANGVRPLVGDYVDGYTIFAAKKDIRMPADLKGMKLRSGGGMQDVTIKELGAVPVVLASPDTYEALQRGTIDGMLINWSSIAPYKFDEVVKYAVRGPSLGAAALVYAINEKKWQSLPQNVKDAMLQAVKDVTPQIYGNEDTVLANVVQDLAKKGMKINELNDQEQTAWTNVLKGVNKTWLDNVSKYGVTDGEQIIQKRDQYAASFK